ncbi:MAG: HAMP domain-containing histidine kinase [Chloroflexi bacterium]|nr:MAG: HAMP domain-containing histidine kinase [Chloroflexota bacterium]
MAERLERTFNWARVGGAALIFFLGPLFPNIGISFVLGLGAFVLVYAAIVAWFLHSGRLRTSFGQITRAMFVIDIAIVAFGMLVFAADPSWTTFVVSNLMVIAGGFRFGTAGAFAAAGALSLAYLGIAAYRADTYGFVIDPPRLAFHVSVMVLAKSEFLAAMSHDFRSPLTVVRGAVELLLGERPGTLTTAQRELAESAERNVRRLEEFTSQLLEIARLEEGQIALEKEEIDAVALVRDVVADHAVLAKQKRQWISLDVDQDPPLVVADRSRMSQALANLLVNAIRYAPQGTPIVVAAHRNGDALRIEVRDHGPGIPREDRQRIFEKFFRGQSANGTPGSGLGLAIARSLVTLHGGTLVYEENPGGGAAFVTSLPLATP